MNGGQVVLAVNIVAAAIFIFGHLIIALANRGQRAALWFSAVYLIGALSPLCSFLAPMLGGAVILERLGFGFLLAALLSVPIAWAKYHGQRAPWAVACAVLAAGLALHEASFRLPPATLLLGFAYQLPFVIAACLAAAAVLATPRRRALHLALAAAYALTAVNFLLKPFIAAAFGFPTGLANYSASKYAMLSQASTGALMLISGMVLLLIVAQRTITEALTASETDPLSGLLNRRGFERVANEALDRAKRAGATPAIAVFDLDRFKAINDQYGHDAGDQAIARFAALLRTRAPDAAIIARLGGEEFALLLESSNARHAWACGEAIRLAAAARPADAPHLSPTVSAGVAQLESGDTLADLLRRADHACYHAKNNGRDRVCLAPARATPAAARLGVAA